jgi:hypothetical protein
MMPVREVHWIKWFGPDVPFPARSHIVQAQQDIVSNTNSAVYEADPATGEPVSAELRELILGAICEQARSYWWDDEAAARSVEASPLGRPLRSASIDGVSWVASGSAIPDAYRRHRNVGLCPAAARLIQNIPRQVFTIG